MILRIIKDELTENFECSHYFLRIKNDYGGHRIIINMDYTKDTQIEISREFPLIFREYSSQGRQTDELIFDIRRV